MKTVIAVFGELRLSHLLLFTLYAYYPYRPIQTLCSSKIS